MIVLSEETKERITGDLFEGLYRKRQIGFGKLFKTIKKELDLDGSIISVVGKITIEIIELFECRQKVP